MIRNTYFLLDKKLKIEVLIKKYFSLLKYGINCLKIQYRKGGEHIKYFNN